MPDHFERNLTLLAILAAVTTAGAYTFFATAPKPPRECDAMSLGFVITGVLPTWMGGRNDKMGTVDALWVCASKYKAEHSWYALAAFSIVYVSLQAFAIPGPLVLSILSGALYPFISANILVSVCATTGASLCFGLSYMLGRPVANRLIPQMIESFRDRVIANRSNLFYYMLFLRFTPLLPNWFVNIASPLVGVPFHLFLFGTFLGLMPANFLHISTGATLQNASSVDDKSGSTNILQFAVLFCLQFVALLPTLFKSKLQALEKRRFNKKIQ